MARFKWCAMSGAKSDSPRGDAILFIAKVVAFVLSLLMVFSPMASAQAYPAKPVRFVVAFAPAGPADITMRLVAPHVSAHWGQQAVVENRPGAGGNIAAQFVAKAPADGYTVLVASTSIAVNPSLMTAPGYDLERDFIAVSIAASTPNMLVAHPSLGVKTLAEAFAKARTMKLSYAHAGAGTTPHLAGEYIFKILGKVDVQNVAYKGGGPAIQAAVAGETPLACMAIPTTVPHIRAGRLVGLAVTSNQRQAVLPDVPTMAELGFPGYEDYTWIGLFVPSQTPTEVQVRLHAEFERALKLPDVRDKLAGLGLEVPGYSLARAAAYVREELGKYARIVRETGAKGE